MISIRDQFNPPLCGSSYSCESWLDDAIPVTVEHPNDLQLGFTNESPVECWIRKQ